MRTTFHVISTDKFSPYLTVNTVFILKGNRLILFTGIIIIYGDHAKHTKCVCKIWSYLNYIHVGGTFVDHR
jgi:hypothetical protein